MSGSGDDRASREVGDRELRHQEPKELPRREGTFNALVEEAAEEPSPEELVAAAVQEEKREQGGEPS